MAADDVRLVQQLMQRFGSDIANGLFVPRGLIRIEPDDPVAERFHAIDHGGSDAADADDAQGLLRRPPEGI